MSVLKHSRISAKAYRRLTRGVIDNSMVWLGRYSAFRDAHMFAARHTDDANMRRRMVGMARQYHRLYMQQLTSARRDIQVYG